MKKIIFVFILFSSAANTQPVVSNPLSIIPRPVSIKQSAGEFKLSKKTVIAVANEEDKKTAHLFNDYLQEIYGFSLVIVGQEGKDCIKLNTRPLLESTNKEAYTLAVSKDGISIEGSTHAATFYGIQTLIQLLAPYDVKSVLNKNVQISSLLIPLVTINDYPAFQYRGMHLDVTRHFFPVSFIKKYIDYLALHKMNYFHWHLTEDQGWRIEIKKYPRLTEVGAFRNGTVIGRYPGSGNDNKRYGGFYTQDDIKDIVQYAMNRHITVIPEIEMPGHSSAAIAAYPWLSCFPDRPTKFPTTASITSTQKQAAGEIKQVQETWGIFPDVYCAGNDSTFLFLQDVIDEVLPLFPSTYIHVGGDECPKTHWKACPRCQARMKKEGLKDEHELQSYFIQRIEKYLNSNGRILIGWDEILEGGLAPNAVVMSWRGEKGGIEAARQKHKVIMTPQKPLYFDHTQSTAEDSVTIGGYNPIENVYNYDPLPKELDDESAKYILGAQANVWTEYMKYPGKVEYMIFPRMSALSEVLWSPKSVKNWNDFEQRLQVHFKRYDLWKANYSKAYYDVKLSLVQNTNFKGIKLIIAPRDKQGEIYYEIKRKNQSLKYSKPIVINENSDIIVSYYRNKKLVNKIPLTISVNKATGKKIVLKNESSKTYPGDGAVTLVDGIVNDKALGRTKEFLGFQGIDMEAFIDLGKKEALKQVTVHILNQPASWIYPPGNIKVFLSQDGRIYKEAGMNDKLMKPAEEKKNSLRIDLQNNVARYVKVVVANWGEIADGSPGAGNKAWLFVDEIQVN
jgi:hexosaminidase